MIEHLGWAIGQAGRFWYARSIGGLLELGPRCTAAEIRADVEATVGGKCPCANTVAGESPRKAGTGWPWVMAEDLAHA